MEGLCDEHRFRKRVPGRIPLRVGFCDPVPLLIMDDLWCTDELPLSRDLGS